MVWETNSSGSTFPWNEVGLFTGEVDLRTEMDNLLDLRGHEVFVRKRTDQRCFCYARRQYDEGNKFCSYCDGYGYYYYDYRYKTRRRPAFGTFGFHPKASTPIGDLMSGDNLFYFKHDNPVLEAYRIMEVYVNADGEAEAPYTIERVHDVKLTHAYRDQNGRIEYWAALAREVSLGK